MYTQFQIGNNIKIIDVHETYKGLSVEAKETILEQLEEWIEEERGVKKGDRASFWNEHKVGKINSYYIGKINGKYLSCDSNPKGGHLLNVLFFENMEPIKDPTAEKLENLLHDLNHIKNDKEHNDKVGEIMELFKSK
jgi:hypothetical protein